MNREMLLSQLTALDFMAVDLGLYLNTHPEDSAAIAEYNKIIKAADMLRAKYEENFGPLDHMPEIKIIGSGLIVHGHGQKILISCLKRGVNNVDL